MQFHQGERQRQEQAAAPDRGEDKLHQFLERVYGRPAKFVDRAGLQVAVDRTRDRLTDIAGEDRLHAGVTAAGQRQCRRQSRHGGEAIEEAVLRAEYDRRPHDDGVAVRGKHALLALGLGTRILRGGIRVGADRGDMDQWSVGRDRRPGECFRALRHHGVEALPAALEQDADKIDGNIGVAQRRRDRIRIAQIGLDRMDLADPAERLQKAGELGTAHRDADAIAAIRQRPYHMAAHKAGAAEYGDERLKLALRAHWPRDS